jgi:phosphatidylglycerophosphatase A
VNRLWQKTAVLLATGFGLGYSPVASGTVGTLPGVVLAFMMAWLGWSWPFQACAALAMTLLAIPVCGAAEKVFGKKDDGRIVADEYLTFPICLLGLPWLQHLWLLPVAFVVARVLDVVKPFPARQSQRVRGGVGIVVDDFISTLYALALNHLVWWGAQRVM